MGSDIVTRKQPVSEGLKKYFTGKPCKHGHIAERQVCSGQCITCKVERTRKWRTKPNNEKFLDKKVAKDLPSLEVLNSKFKYDPVTGVLTFRHRGISENECPRTYKAWVARCSGKEAGARHYANGYLEVRVEGRNLYKVHRLIWKIMTGEDPSFPIDHVNGVPWDNRWCNLRLATNQENARNCKAHSDSGFKGVARTTDGYWRAQWCVEDENHFKNGFRSAESAARYYDEVVKDLYGAFAKLNFEEESCE